MRSGWRVFRIVSIAGCLFLVGGRATAQTHEGPATPPGADLRPRERGFALESSIGLQVGSTPVGAIGLRGNLFAGYEIGRVIVGLDLQLGGSFGAYGDSSATQFVLAGGPGVRIALVRSSDRRLELVGQLDIGAGHTFGGSGPGWDAVLGLPPGATLGNDSVQVYGALGPAIRYWLHRQFAVQSSVLVRGDYTTMSQDPYPRYTRFDFNVVVVLGVLGVL
jgi:hypothetical protein